MGQEIRSRRKARGLTQRQLGEILGVDEVIVSRWETGANLPSLPMAQALARALRCRVDDLLVEPDTPEAA